MEFPAFLRAMGLRPRTIKADGQWRRCPTDDHPHKLNGSYRLELDGRMGWGKNWATMARAGTWRAEGHTTLPPVDLGALKRAQTLSGQAKLKAIHAARTFYLKCPQLLGGHPYLQAKGLGMEGCYGLKRDAEGWLVVPTMRAGRVVSVQRISPTGDKLFWPGAPVMGSHYLIDRKAAVINVICEGLATGLAVYRAVPGSRVFVAWSAGNLIQPYPNLVGLTVIAADNDHKTADRIGHNPGLEAAAAAAAAIGCQYAYPTGIEGSDWSDYWQEAVALKMSMRYKGLPTVSEIHKTVDAQIKAQLMRVAVFRPLALSGQTHSMVSHTTSIANKITNHPSL